jgi:hypothetical protein
MFRSKKVNECKLQNYVLKLFDRFNLDDQAHEL